MSNGAVMRSSTDPLNGTSPPGTLSAMTTAESRRHDLYNGLTEFLGEDRADTLMAYLPSQESADLATRADLDAVEMAVNTRIDTLETTVINRFNIVDQRFEATSQRLDALSQRLDRMVLTLVAGLVAIVATLIAQSFI
jgi:hypothetical protein